MKKKKIIGIDLGTSSVKVLCTDGSEIQKARAGYAKRSPEGWLDAVCRALRSLDVSDAGMIGLSSQVGTYLINDEEVINWYEDAGRRELECLLQEISGPVFLSEISMNHPKTVSYPLPRLQYILSHYDNVKKVCMPKDLLIERMTGEFVTDKYSWRGLCSLESGMYSQKLLRHIGFPPSVLPAVKDFNETAGYVTAEFAEKTGLAEGIPVVTGLNDFYAGLLGMGQIYDGQMFDITGTSEHLGYIGSSLPENTSDYVAGPFIRHHAIYGVTASSGASLEFADRMEHILDTPFEGDERQIPVFLPYLNGERAPIWDGHARGAYVGIDGSTTKRELALSAAEGIVMSLYHIYDSLGRPGIGQLTAAGGASGFRLLNELKATLFDCELVRLCEPDTSALGAVISASMCGGESLESAVRRFVEVKEIVKPVSSGREKLLERYEIYKSLYPALKPAFDRMHGMERRTIQ